jgi:thioesterase domain-containing protein
MAAEVTGNNPSAPDRLSQEKANRAVTLNATIPSTRMAIAPRLKGKPGHTGKSEKLWKVYMYQQSLIALEAAPLVNAKRPEARPEAAANILIPLRPEGTRSPFFCVHPIGGDAQCFESLAQEMDRDRPFYGLESPLLHDHAARPESIVEMASLYIAAIRKVQPEGPYLLGGWSFGGAVAMEMTRQLQAAGETVAELVLLDVCAAAPRRFNLERFGRQLGADSRLFPVYDAHLELWRSHQSAPLSVRATHFIAGGREEDHGFALRASRKTLPIHGIGVVRVPGDHSSMLSGENAAGLAARIDAVLDAAEWRAAGRLAAA